LTSMVAGLVAMLVTARLFTVCRSASPSPRPCSSLPPSQRCSSARRKLPRWDQRLWATSSSPITSRLSTTSANMMAAL
jgi:hypothetical protein